MLKLLILFSLSLALPAFAAREKRGELTAKAKHSDYEFDLKVGSDPELPPKSLEAVNEMHGVLVRDLATWPWIIEHELDATTVVFAHSNGPLSGMMFGRPPAVTTLSLTINGNKSILVFWDRVLGRADSALVYTLGAVAGELYAQYHLVTPSNSPPHLAEAVKLKGTIDFYRYLFRSPNLMYYGITERGELDHQLKRSIARYEALRVQPEFSHPDCKKLLTSNAN